MAVKIFAHTNSDKLAEALGRFIVQEQNKAISEHANFNIAVSGGSLIKSLRAGLAKNPEADWSKWQIFFADERVVPLNHENSNYGLLKRELLDHITVQPQTFTIDPSLSCTKTIAESYQKVLLDRLGPSARFDLVLLGCGPDGHTCSLFPEHPLLSEKTLLVAAIDDSPKPPSSRVTLTKPVLSKATKIVFVAEGAGKATVLKDVFENSKCELPAAQVNRLAQSPAIWFVDSAAIENININRCTA